MKKIFISGAHGSACSLIKSMFTGIKQIDPIAGTCHQSWETTVTTNKDLINWHHSYGIDYIQKRWNPNVLVYLQINPKNIVQICRRIVILDFMYTQDPDWARNNWCWTKEKHDSLAGPDWPQYSINIYHYPKFCLDEMTQVAYERTCPWIQTRTGFDYTLDTAEFFSGTEPHSLQHCFNSLGCNLDMSFVENWRNTNNKLYATQADLFSWTTNYVPPEGWISAVDNGYSKVL